MTCNKIDIKDTDIQYKAQKCKFRNNKEIKL